MEPSEVSRYILAAQVMADLADFDQKPVNGGQCRVLSRLGCDERKKVWDEVLKTGEKPTARLIEQMAKKSGLLTSTRKQEAPPKEQSFVVARQGRTHRLLGVLLHQLPARDPARRRLV